MKTLLLLALLGIPCLALSVSAQPANSPSPLVADVLRLARAKVDETVMLAFVQASAGKASVSADELLELRALGVSSRFQIALLNHGQPVSEPAPPPLEPAPPKSNAPAAEAGQLTPIPAAPEPVASPPTDYVSVASPVYVGVGSSYYPYSDAYCGLGWDLGLGLSWWGWSSCYPFGYPWYGYGYGYGYHCGDGHGHDGHHGNHYHQVDPNKTGNPNYVSSPQGGKPGVEAKAAGSGRPTQGATVVRPGPVAGTAAGLPKVGQPSAQASVTPGSSRPGAAPSSQVTRPSSPVVSNPSSQNPRILPGTNPNPGGQSVKPTFTWAGTTRTGQPGAPKASPALPGAGTRVTPVTRPAVKWSGGSASSSGSSPMRVRTSTVYSGSSGAKSFSNPGSFSSRPSAGYSRGYSAPSRSFSSPSVGSRGYSGGASRGGFSGSRGGGFAGGHGGRR